MNARNVVEYYKQKSEEALTVALATVKASSCLIGRLTNSVYIGLVEGTDTIRLNLFL